VFRGFLDGTNQLQFATDDRSEKIEQIAHQPWGEICWYFPNTREQFRLTGKLTLVAADHPDPNLRQARQQLWQAMSDAARIQFAWSHPGQPRAADDDFSPPPPDSQQPLSQFRLLLLEPTQVDHLELRGDPQNRYRYVQKDNLQEDNLQEDSPADERASLATERQWSVESVNP
jgi:PPOX class probable FMN-dependent enzyme